MRRSLIVGNWKMSLGLSESRNLARGIRQGLAGRSVEAELMVCPSYPFLLEVAEILEGSTVGVGAQDLVFQDPGAFTGGVSAAQLSEIGAACCILGHSERREHFGDSDAIVGAKLGAALASGLVPILCFGESENTRLEGRTEAFVRQQIETALESRRAEELGSLILAYEPIWAIGTGNNAEAADAQSVHAFVRQLLRERLGEDLADRTRILYGGSVKPQNIESYLACEDIDGALVGGASLAADSYLQLASAG